MTKDKHISSREVFNLEKSAVRAMQELAKSLEALGLSTLDGLTKKELRKVKEAIIGFSDSVREPVKNVLADFAREGGGGTPPFR